MIGREEKVKRIIRERFLSEIDLGFRHMEKYIRRKYFGGLLVLFMAIFSTYSRHIKKLAVTQIKLIFDTLDREVDDVLVRKFSETDLAYVYLKKRHPNFPEIQEIIQESLIASRKPIKKLVSAGLKMSAKHQLTYDDIARTAYPKASDARKVLEERIEKGKEIYEIIKRDPSILNVPVGRHMILDVLRETLAYSKKRMLEDLMETYGEVCP
jgi:hypothetical protein